MAEEEKMSLADKKVHKASSEGDHKELKKLLEKKGNANSTKVSGENYQHPNANPECPHRLGLPSLPCLFLRRGRPRCMLLRATTTTNAWLCC